MGDEARSRDVWVVVETHKGQAAVFSYRGRVRRQDLEAWRCGKLQGAITLRNAYWLDEDNGRLAPVVVGRHGEFRHGTGALHIAMETVVIIMELTQPDAGVLDEGTTARVFSLDAVRPPSVAPGPPSDARSQQNAPPMKKTPDESADEAALSDEEPAPEDL